jgi:hypothetical protein
MTTLDQPLRVNGVKMNEKWSSKVKIKDVFTSKFGSVWNKNPKCECKKLVVNFSCAVNNDCLCYFLFSSFFFNCFV